MPSAKFLGWTALTSLVVVVLYERHKAGGLPTKRVLRAA